MTTTTTSTTRKVRFDDHVSYREAAPGIKVLGGGPSTIWWDDRELEIHQQLDLIDARKEGGERRGLEMHFDPKFKSQCQEAASYVKQVVQKSKVVSKKGFLLRRNNKDPEKSVQKFCTKYSRKSTTRALRRAQEDQEQALAIQMEMDQLAKPKMVMRDSSDATAATAMDLSDQTQNSGMDASHSLPLRDSRRYCGEMPIITMPEGGLNRGISC